MGEFPELRWFSDKAVEVGGVGYSKPDSTEFLYDATRVSILLRLPFESRLNLARTDQRWLKAGLEAMEIYFSGLVRF